MLASLLIGVFWCVQIVVESSVLTRLAVKPRRLGRGYEARIAMQFNLFCQPKVHQYCAGSLAVQGEEAERVSQSDTPVLVQSLLTV